MAILSMKSLLGTMGLVWILSGTPAQAANLGLVADNSSKKVTVFNADAGTVLSTVTIPTFGRLGDCALKQDQTEGYVSDSTSAIWVLDLTASPPRLSGGANPIRVPIHPQELAVTCDQKYLLAAGSHLPEPICTVEISTRLVRSTFSTGGDCNGLDLSADGTVLVGSARSNLVRRLTLSSTGVLTASGVQRAAKEPMNPYTTRNGKFGVVVTFRPGTLTSFTNSTLATINSRTFTGGADGISAVVSPDGTRCFVRTSLGVDAFVFSAATGVLGSSPLFHIPAPYPSNIAFYGMDQLALGAGGTLLYVGVAGALRVHSASSGALLNILVNPGGIVQPTGICVKNNVAPVVSLPAPFSVSSTSPLPVTANLFDADGDTLSVEWSVDGGAPVQLDTVPGIGPPTTGSRIHTQGYTVGTHTLQVTAYDGNGNPTIVSTTITVLQTITVTGIVFFDKNNNQRQDTGETTLSNWCIYADANNNGKLDATEPSTLSGANGTYALVVPVPGTYYIREVVQTGWKQTAPTSGYLKVIATLGLTPVCNFGNRQGN